MHTPAPIELMNVCLLRDDANRMLVQDRTDPSWPVLCFPGGHVEIGETCADAVVREMQEETGLTVGFAPARRHQGVDEARRADPRAGAVL